MGRRLSNSLLQCLAVVALAGCGGAGSDGAARYELETAFADEPLEQVLVVPDRPSKLLLVLLHGRSSTPDTVLSYFEDTPFAILAPSGGDHSYYHDRDDGAWGSYILRVAIPEAVRRTGATRVAIGGISMGGFGALDLARIAPGRFCAVGAHSPALWLSGGETPAGAFDDAEDFEQHDVLEHAANGGRFGSGRVWLDVGEDDPFHAATVELGRRLGRRAELHVWPGGHDGDYWRAHGRQYGRFYERACRLRG